MKTHTLQKAFILFAFVLMAFALGDGKSEYIIPHRAFSINTSNINLDENKEIIIGNFTSWQQSNPTITILKNDGLGYFTIIDTSLSFCGYQENIFATKVNQDEFPDIVSFYSDFSSGQPERFIRILYNYSGTFTEYSDFNLNSSSTITDINYGDVDGNDFDDIVVIINNDFLWGIIYNDGTGNFSEPEYFDLDYPPLDIACADLNDDGRDDVVITDYIIEIYFSTPNGFEQQLLGYAIPWSSGYNILPSDFDNDGDIDVIVSANSNSNHCNIYMFENLGNNQFYQHPYFEFSPFCSYARTADFNNDSLPDVVFVAQDNSGLFIYKNKGDFQLEFDQFIQVDNDALLQRLTCTDFDNNGYNDIALVKGYWGNTHSILELFFNNGYGGFQENPVTNTKKFKNYNLFKCYPNPFKINTTIEIKTNKNEDIEIIVFDISGKQIKKLTNKIYSPGKYKIKWNGTDKNRKPACLWNGTDQSGREVKPGTYFIRLKTGSQIQTKRVIKIK